MGVALVTQYVVTLAKEEQGDMVLATEGLRNNSNKMESFGCKDE